MLKTPDWAAGAEYLREHAPELIPLIDRFPVCELKPEPKEKYFGTLVTGIVSQQLPPDVSLQLLEKLGKFLGQVTIEKFSEMTDAEITKQLVQIRGLGQWTIEMFLLLALCRTDVIPSADFIFKKELKLLMGLSDIPKRGQISKITEHWRPWRSLGVWYLWQFAAEKEQEEKVVKKKN